MLHRKKPWKIHDAKHLSIIRGLEWSTSRLKMYIMRIKYK